MARQGRPSIAAPSHISGALLQQRCAPAPSLHALPDGLLQSQTLFHAWAAPWTLRPPLNHPTFLLSTPEFSAGWQRGPLRRCSSREFAKLVKSSDAAEVRAQLLDCTAFFFAASHLLAWPQPFSHLHLHCLTLSLEPFSTALSSPVCSPHAVCCSALCRTMPSTLPVDRRGAAGCAAGCQAERAR